MRKIKAYYLEHTLIDFHVLLVAASFLLWLVSKFTRSALYSRAGYVLLFAAVFSFILHSNLRGLHMYMKSASGITYLPEARIRNMNRLFTAFYLLLSGAVMIILPGSFIRNMLETIRGCIKSAMSRILQWIFGREPVSSGGITATHDINYNAAESSSGGADLLQALLSLFQDIMKIVGILFLLYLCYAAVLALYRHLTEREAKSAVDDYRYIETDGIRASVSRGRSSVKSQDNGSGASLKVRKLYKTTIQRSIRKSTGNSRLYRKRKKQLPSLLSALTPSEIETFAKVPCDQQYFRLHDLYEKARYSANGVTDSERDSINQ